MRRRYRPDEGETPVRYSFDDGDDDDDDDDEDNDKVLAFQGKTPTIYHSPSGN